MKDANTSPLGRHVVVRLARLPDWTGHLDALDGILQDEDRARAARFRFPEDRARFLLGRKLLSASLDELPGPHGTVLGLKKTERGRPILKDYPDIQFSISHSGELVVLALSLKSSVGIDLEIISRISTLSALAEKIFSESDLERFVSLAPLEHPAFFFHAWTAKEACLKALGLGLPGGLKKIAVPWGPSEVQRSELFHPDPHGGPWCLQRLPLPEGYTGCVVWDDPAKSVHFRVVQPTP